MIEILTIAALDWRNGHEFALQALKILQQRGYDFKYWIIGDGDFLEATVFACRELGLQKHVCLLRSASEKELEKRFEDADVFLLAAVGSDGKHGLFKAVERGLPVVITDLPQLLEGIGPDTMYLIVPRRDAEALADFLQQISNSILHSQPNSQGS
jgi:colanic acid/amylovoran biosynthesis glycosyltransferase